MLRTEPAVLQLLQPRLKLRRQGGHHYYRISRGWLLKLDAMRVQEVAAQVRLRRRTVERVAHYRMFDARQMDARAIGRSIRPLSVFTSPCTRAK